jgi:hypothetical protein
VNRLETDSSGFLGFDVFREIDLNDASIKTWILNVHPGQIGALSRSFLDSQIEVCSSHNVGMSDCEHHSIQGVDIM